MKPAGSLNHPEVIWDLTSAPGAIYLPLPCCLNSLLPQFNSPVMEGDSSAREEQSRLGPRSSAGAVSGSAEGSHSSPSPVASFYLTAYLLTNCIQNKRGYSREF